MDDPADIHRRALDLAKALIARPSITPDDGGCLDLLTDPLRKAGFACERIDRGAVRNLLNDEYYASPDPRFVFAPGINGFVTVAVKY